MSISESNAASQGERLKLNWYLGLKLCMMLQVKLKKNLHLKMDLELKGKPYAELYLKLDQKLSPRRIM